EHQELVFISQNGMVQRTSVRGINRYGRASQGVRVMNIRDDDQVSAVALVVESEASTAAQVAEDFAADAEASPEVLGTGEPDISAESPVDGDEIADDDVDDDVDDDLDGSDPAVEEE
ncbi:MAG TPA: DNA gyrase C-terminal beta-propeller domain-containing protein, partial [Solirubrobacteraceae bacterium]|nr:DNA gyrase C-terminal beta-propeller domain-containing protein [Solirubrobacteraceae bacterium]